MLGNQAKGPFHSRLLLVDDSATFPGRVPETGRRWPLDLFGPGGINLLGGETRIILPGTDEPVPFTRETIEGFSLRCVKDPADPEGTHLGWLEYGGEPNVRGDRTWHDSWVFHELGGTGTVIWCVYEGILYIGFVRQRRNCEQDAAFNQSGSILNIPRGFLDTPKQGASEAARKELYEEVGVFAGVPEDLGGQNANANNAWFAYDPMEVGASRAQYQGGVRFFGVQVKPDVLQEAPNEAMCDVLAGLEDDVTLQIIKRKGGLRVLGFKPDALKPGKGDGSPYEKIKNGVTFLPVHVATDLRDGFAVAGAARLVSWLQAKRATKITYDLSVLE